MCIRTVPTRLSNTQADGHALSGCSHEGFGSTREGAGTRGERRRRSEAQRTGDVAAAAAAESAAIAHARVLKHVAAGRRAEQRRRVARGPAGRERERLRDARVLAQVHVDLFRAEHAVRATTVFVSSLASYVCTVLYVFIRGIRFHACAPPAFRCRRTSPSTRTKRSTRGSLRGNTWHRHIGSSTAARSLSSCPPRPASGQQCAPHAAPVRLHARYWMAAPLQLAPPFAGDGFVQVLQDQ